MHALTNIKVKFALEWLVFLLPKLEVVSSKIGTKTGYTYAYCTWSSLVPPGRYIQSRHERCFHALVFNLCNRRYRKDSLNTAELILSGLIGTANHPDKKKIRIT
jgi:hypothetical protein